MKKERVNEIYGVLLLLVGLFSLISLFFYDPSDNAFFTSNPNLPIQNGAGVTGAFLAHYLILALGFSAYSFPAVILFSAGCCFLQKVPQKKFIEFIGIATATLSFAAILTLIANSSWKIKAGGLLGYFCASTLERYFGFVGGLVIALSCLCLSVLLSTDFLFFPLFEKIYQSISNLIMTRVFKRSFASAKRPKPAPKPKVKVESPLKEAMTHWKTKFEEAVPIRVKKYDPKESEKNGKEAKKDILSVFKQHAAPKETVQREKIVPAKIEKAEAGKEIADISLKPQKRSVAYVLPTLDLLNMPPKDDAPIQDDVQENSKILEETLNDFGIEVKVVEVEQGPVITRYEILPAPGVKVTRILSLSDDIALAMKARSVRFIAPIPGKSAIGIEIPNSVTAKVYLRELLESKDFRDAKFQLPLALGKDTGGQPIISDLTDMPHLLIAGTTGSGKTVCVNAIISGLVYSKTPEDLKFVMIDPKMVELAIYRDLPHMLTPVVTDVRKAAATLNWVVAEMERRYKYFAHCGTRNIAVFNTREAKKEPEFLGESGEAIPTRLPYIIIVIDELADLMMVAQDKVEGAITRLAQLSRAVGIHLILATQRPSVDVITGVIKANFPARISFKVASKVDSRTVLDVNGADKLLGKGDMLFLEPGQEKPIRGQSSLVTDEEINRVVNALKENGPPVYHPDIQAAQEGKVGTSNQEKDELYDEAVRCVLECRVASVSTLQRRLRLGYGRAARMIDMMEEQGIVGPFQGSRPRDILIDKLEDVPKK